MTCPDGPFAVANQYQARLQNVTGATTLAIGQSGTSPQALANADQGNALVVGAFTVAAGQALELQVRPTTTRATDGFGRPASFGTEVYAVVELWKTA